jgi:hypothetical protein
LQGRCTGSRIAAQDEDRQVVSPFRTATKTDYVFPASGDQSGRVHWVPIADDLA